VTVSVAAMSVYLRSLKSLNSFKNLWHQVYQPLLFQLRLFISESMP
jgi:hypothetical protein